MGPAFPAQRGFLEIDPAPPVPMPSLCVAGWYILVMDHALLNCLFTRDSHFRLAPLLTLQVKLL